MSALLEVFPMVLFIEERYRLNADKKKYVILLDYMSQ